MDYYITIFFLLLDFFCVHVRKCKSGRYFSMEHVVLLCNFSVARWFMLRVCLLESFQLLITIYTWTNKIQLNTFKLLDVNWFVLKVVHSYSKLQRCWVSEILAHLLCNTCHYLEMDSLYIFFIFLFLRLALKWHQRSLRIFILDRVLLYFCS